MAGQLTKLLIFMVTAHMLFYVAGQAGLIQFQEEEENPHREFIEVFADGELKENVNVEREQSGVLERITDVFLSIPIISDIYEIVFGPYMLIGNIEMPWALKTLIQAILGVLELTAMITLIRGVNV